MNESLLIAKMNAFRYLTEEEKKETMERNIRVHFANGANSKDGPSAGISSCTAMVSLFKNQRVNS